MGARETMPNHITVSSAQAFVQADAPKHSEKEWAKIIRGDLERAVEGIIAAGTHLQQAKYQLAHGRLLPLLKSIGLHERTAERLMKIAANVVLANPTHGSKLPTSMRTLYELSTLPVKLLEAKISDGTITPDIERKDVKQLKRKKSSDEVELDGRTVERNLLPTEQLKIAKTKITTLEAKLKSGSSLFDLKADTVEDIAAVIVANIHESKAAALAKAIPEAIKELKRKRQKLAG
jgi:endonuclease III